MSLLLGVVLLQVAPSLPAAQVAGAMCEISGRVTDKETGQPIARAIVGLSTDGGKTRLATRTDDEGVYRFTNLPPGQYMGHVEPAEFRATHIGTPIGPALLKPGDVRRDINVALQPGRAITVRVVDDAGEAVAGMHVSLRTLDGGREFNSSTLRGTDDRGRLRLFGLPPGRYIACAEPRSGSFTAAGSQLRRERLLRTCHPAAAASGEAEPIRLDQSDIEDIEIRLRRGRTFTISGTVLDSSGAAASGAVVSLNRFERNGSSSTGMPVNDGRFTVANVPPGDYAITASIGGKERPELRRDLEEAFVPVHIDSSDVTDLVVTMTKAVVVAGRITLEPPMPKLPRDPFYGPMLIDARLLGRQLPGRGGSRGASVGDDGVFYLDRMFGTRRLEVFNIPRGWYVKSIQYEGKDITNSSIEFKGSRDPSRLEVVLSNRGGIVSGRVVDDRGDPVRGGRVILFPANPELWNERQVLGVNISPGGTFKLGPQRAGDYLVVAFDPSTLPPNLLDRERLARLAPDAERVTLREDEERPVDLRVVRTAR